MSPPAFNGATAPTTNIIVQPNQAKLGAAIEGESIVSAQHNSLLRGLGLVQDCAQQRAEPTVKQTNVCAGYRKEETRNSTGNTSLYISRKSRTVSHSLTRWTCQMTSATQLEASDKKMSRTSWLDPRALVLSCSSG